MLDSHEDRYRSWLLGAGAICGHLPSDVRGTPVHHVAPVRGRQPSCPCPFDLPSNHIPCQLSSANGCTASCSGAKEFCRTDIRCIRNKRDLFKYDLLIETSSSHTIMLRRR